MKNQILTSLFLFALSAAGAPAAIANHVKARQTTCKDVYVIFARGTLESPPIGSIVGPDFNSTLYSLLPSVDLVGVDYPASIPGYLEGGDPAGISDAENKATTYAAQCSSAKIVLSGYSQGAQIAHKALDGLESSGSRTFSQIKAIVTWGDPYHNKTTYGVPFKYYCNTGDYICDDTDIVTPAHLTYGINGDAAAGAQWVAGVVG